VNDVGVIVKVLSVLAVGVTDGHVATPYTALALCHAIKIGG